MDAHAVVVLSWATMTLVVVAGVAGLTARRKLVARREDPEQSGDYEYVTFVRLQHDGKWWKWWVLSRYQHESLGHSTHYNAYEGNSGMAVSQRDAWRLARRRVRELRDADAALDQHPDPYKKFS